MFLPDGHSRTFGEMSAEEKHGWRPGKPEALSHRARAFKLLAERLPGRAAMSAADRRTGERAPLSASMCIGRSARRSARIATSTATSAISRRTRSRFSAGARARAFTFRRADPGAHRHLDLPRRRHAIADAAGDGRRGARGDRAPVAGRARRGDHARSQSGQRRGGALSRLSRRRRQSPVARRAVARRCRAEGARPHPRRGGGAPRRGARAEHLPAPLLRPDLRAPGQTPRAWQAELEAAIAMAADHLSLYQLTIEPETPFFRLHQAGKLAVPDGGARGGVLCADAGYHARRAAFPPTKSPTTRRPARSRATTSPTGATRIMSASGPGAHGRITVDGVKRATMSEKHPGELAGEGRRERPRPRHRRGADAGGGRRRDAADGPEAARRRAERALSRR